LRLRDRAVLLKGSVLFLDEGRLSGPLRVHYNIKQLLVIITVPVLAIMLATVKKGSIDRLFFRVDGYARELLAKFRNMNWSIWKNVAVNYPSPEVQFSGHPKWLNSVRVCEIESNSVSKDVIITLKDWAYNMSLPWANRARVSYCRTQVGWPADKSILRDSARTFVCLKQLHYLDSRGLPIIKKMFLKYPSLASWQLVRESLGSRSLTIDERSLHRYQCRLSEIIGPNHLPPLSVGNGSVENSSDKGSPRSERDEYLYGIVASVLSFGLSLYIPRQAYLGSDRIWLLACLLPIAFFSGVYGISLLLQVFVQGG